MLSCTLKLLSPPPFSPSCVLIPLGAVDILYVSGQNSPSPHYSSSLKFTLPQSALLPSDAGLLYGIYHNMTPIVTELYVNQLPQLVRESSWMEAISYQFAKFIFPPLSFSFSSPTPTSIKHLLYSWNCFGLLGMSKTLALSLRVLQTGGREDRCTCHTVVT